MRFAPPGAVLQSVVTFGASARQPMLFQVTGFDIGLPRQANLILKSIVLDLSLLVEHNLWVARSVKVPRRGVDLRQSLLVPLVVLWKSDHSSRQLDLITSMQHVLTSTPINAHEDSLMPSPAISVGCRLVASILEAAHFTERHQLGLELSGSHSLIRSLAIMPLRAPRNQTS